MGNQYMGMHKFGVVGVNICTEPTLNDMNMAELRQIYPGFVICI